MPQLAPFGPGAVAAALGIVLAAAVLRFSYLDTGIPYAVGPDEPQVMIRVSHMMVAGTSR